MPTAIQAQTPETSAVNEPALINHRLTVTLDPQNQSIEVADFLAVPESMRGQEVVFQLNANLTISASSPRVEELPSTLVSNTSNTTVAAVARSKRYRVRLPNGDQDFYLTYQGQINDQARQIGGEYAQSFSATSGIISEQGVFLSAASMWIPSFADELLSFTMDVSFADTAASWTAMSQGTRVENETNADTWSWRESQPMEEIYLIAADFTVYSEQAEEALIEAYLRTH